MKKNQCLSLLISEYNEYAGFPNLSTLPEPITRHYQESSIDPLQISCRLGFQDGPYGLVLCKLHMLETSVYSRESYAETGVRTYRIVRTVVSGKLANRTARRHFSANRPLPSLAHLPQIHHVSRTKLSLPKPPQ